MKVELRPMREADLARVVVIEGRSFAAPWSESTFRGLMRRPSASLIAAERGGRLVGYYAMWFAAHEAELGDLVVHPSYRRKGIGGKLLAHALQEAGRRSAKTVFLEVRQSNEAAKALYEAAGFSVLSVRRGYYSMPKEDAIVMHMKLGEEAR
ncbi:MAG: ribosomal protein S18-alanine N-acetyltransferase [Gemmatimonadota bacterium]